MIKKAKMQYIKYTPPRDSVEYQPIAFAKPILSTDRTVDRRGESPLAGRFCFAFAEGSLINF